MSKERKKTAISVNHIFLSLTLLLKNFPSEWTMPVTFLPDLSVSYLSYFGL